jgi:hypothetical protein
MDYSCSSSEGSVVNHFDKNIVYSVIVAFLVDVRVVFLVHVMGSLFSDPYSVIVAFSVQVKVVLSVTRHGGLFSSHQCSLFSDPSPIFIAIFSESMPFWRY